MSVFLCAFGVSFRAWKTTACESDEASRGSDSGFRCINAGIQKSQYSAKESFLVWRTAEVPAAWVFRWEGPLTFARYTGQEGDEGRNTICGQAAAHPAHELQQLTATPESTLEILPGVARMLTPGYGSGLDPDVFIVDNAVWVVSLQGDSAVANDTAGTPRGPRSSQRVGSTSQLLCRSV